LNRKLDDCMSEFGNCIPILGLLIPAISLVVAVLTYLRVSRRYVSRACYFPKEIKPKEDRTLFSIDGTGILQKIEIVATGSPDAMITASVDGLVFLRETFSSFVAKGSTYVRRYQLPNPQGIGQFSIEMDLQKNFFKSIELSIDNRHETALLKVRGTVHYNICEPRLRFHLRKKRRQLTDLSAKTKSA
jgi:hypothetical protein